MLDLSQRWRLLQARMTDAELLDTISTVLYERGDLGEVIDEVLETQNANLAAMRRAAEEAGRRSAEQWRNSEWNQPRG